MGKEEQEKRVGKLDLNNMWIVSGRIFYYYSNHPFQNILKVSPIVSTFS